MPKPVGWALTFLAVVAAWVLFRAESLERASFILKSMLSFNTLAGANFAAPLEWLKSTFSNITVISIARMLWGLTESRTVMLVVATFVAFAMPNAAQIAARLRTANGKRLALFSLFIGLVIVYTFLHLNRVSEFLYFQF